MRSLLPVVATAVTAFGCHQAEGDQRLVGAGEATLTREWGQPALISERSGDEQRFRIASQPLGRDEEWPSARITYYLYPDRDRTVRIEHGKIVDIRPLTQTERRIAEDSLRMRGEK